MENLNQKRFGHGKRTFQIIDGKRLRVSSKSLTGGSDQTFNLFEIDQRFEGYTDRPLKWLFIGLLFVFMAIPIMLNAIYIGDSAVLVTGFVVLLPGLICVQQFFQKSQNLIVFRFRGNGEVAFFLWKNKPNSKAVEEFTDELVKTIESINVNPDISCDEKLEIYKQYLEILFAEDVLTAEEASHIFERTKAKLKKAKSAAILSIAE